MKDNDICFVCNKPLNDQKCSGCKKKPSLCTCRGFDLYGENAMKEINVSESAKRAFREWLHSS